MLLQRHRQIVLPSAALLIFVLCAVIYANVKSSNAGAGLNYHWRSGTWSSVEFGSLQNPGRLTTHNPIDYSHAAPHGKPAEEKKPEDQPKDKAKSLFEPTKFAIGTHHEIFSQSTKEGRYFLVRFEEERTINPNIVSHPTKKDVWFIIAQQHKTKEQNWAWFTELACEASFRDGDLQCLHHPTILPIASTSSPHCSGDLDYYDAGIGPHDARVFHGPDRPYVIYGSQSQHSCFGLWMQDFRRLVDWQHEYDPAYAFRHATDLQRPAPHGPVEKNWFVFWDIDGQIHAHYDIYPKRAYAKLNKDGSVGDDLAHLAHEADDRCMKRIMASELEEPDSKFHQATNSLSITMCVKNDPGCKKTPENTFIMTIFQRKTERSLHCVYEPYVMLFGQKAPFPIHALSKKPLWIHGRRVPGEHKVYDDDVHPPQEQSEMLYITSMSWKDPSRLYHGYLDDVLFIGFGIEDCKTGGIDVLASDLLAAIERCDS